MATQILTADQTKELKELRRKIKENLKQFDKAECKAVIESDSKKQNYLEKLKNTWKETEVNADTQEKWKKLDFVVSDFFNKVNNTIKK